MYGALLPSITIGPTRQLASQGAGECVGILHSGWWEAARADGVCTMSLNGDGGDVAALNARCDRLSEPRDGPQCKVFNAMAPPAMPRPMRWPAAAALLALGVLAAAAAHRQEAASKARGRPATAMAVMLACLVNHAAAAASSPPDPNVHDTIVSNATALRAAIEDGRTRRIPLSLHVVGRIALSEAGFMWPEEKTFLDVWDRQLVTLWSEEGEGTLDAEGGGRVFWVRPPTRPPARSPPAARPCAAAAP